MLAGPGSERQRRAYSLVAWLFRQGPCAACIARRLGAFAGCEDRGLQLAAALLIRHLAEPGEAAGSATAPHAAPLCTRTSLSCAGL